MFAAKSSIPVFVLVVFYSADVFASNVHSCSEDDVCSEYGNRYMDDYTRECCEPCLCVGNCTYGKCCPDVSNFEINTQSECKHQLEFIKGYTDTTYLRSIHVYLRRFYNVVSKCPTDVPLNLRAACEYTNGTDGSNYVSDVVTYTIYKNEMCARCNGVELYVKWMWAISANLSQTNMLISENYDEHSVLGLMNGNIKFSIPPIGYPEDLNVCVDEAIDTCNSSGKWEQYDSKLDKLCVLSNFVTVQVESEWFKNIYCALCNIPAVDLSSRKCESGISYTRFSHWSFHTIISWYEEDKRIPDKNDSNIICSGHQRIDPLENVCRNIICPLGMHAKAGLCRQIFIIDDIAVDLSIMLQASRTDSFTWQDMIESSIIPKLHVEKLGCSLCQWKLGFMDDTEDKILLVLRLQTSPICNIKTLREAVRRYEGRITTLKILNTSSQGQKLNITIAFYYKQSSKKVKDWFHVDNKKTCRFHCPLPPKYYCTAVVISNESRIYKLAGNLFEDFISLSTPAVLHPDLKPNVANDRMICITDYLRIVSELNRSSSMYLRIPTLTYVCHAIIFVFIADNWIT